MLRTGLLIASVMLLLNGCAATTPLVLAGGSGHQFLSEQEHTRLRAAAALSEEPDLLTYSVKAIAENRSDDVVNTYLQGYTDPRYSQAIKSLALYQIGLIYMNRFNDQRDDQKALTYFQRHLIEYPESMLHERIQKRMALINERAQQTVQSSPEQLLATLDADKLLNQPKIAYDEELTPMSERAISEDRLEDAEGVYMVVYTNKGSGDSVRAKALYQLGLIYMSPYNKHARDQKALYYFRKIIEEFPQSSVAKRAEHRISELHNRQSPATAAE
jgi:TPR repeat protein